MEKRSERYRRPKRSGFLPTREQVNTERQRIKHEAAYRKALFGTIDVLILVAALAVLISTLFLPVLQISGDSMEPTLHNEDIIVLVKTDNFDTGDLCSFSWNNRTLVKRVIGTPGDWIEIDMEGNIFLNGEELDEPYVTDKSLGECDIKFPYQVPEDSLFMVGDHRETSIDSRNTVIGSVNYDQVVGKILFRIWPLNQLGPVR